jgi:1,4-dihydroxy-2-naphthoate polyprenyltransferase
MVVPAAPSPRNHNADAVRRDRRPNRPPWYKIWLTAARPHTLTASLCPCLVAWATTVSRPPTTLSTKADHSTVNALLVTWLWFCVSVQIGTNLHNDYADYIQGADDASTRLGQARATAMGWLTPTQTCTAATVVLITTALAGLRLVALTREWSNGWLWFWLTSSVFNAFAYTSGPYPLGYIGLGHYSIAYAGLGDVFVFVYFGLVATWMVPYLLHRLELDATGTASSGSGWFTSWSLSTVVHGVQVGLLATNIIIVNNLRDRHGDALVQKRTTSVRFGRTFSTTQYMLCNALAYGLILYDATVVAASHNGTWPFMRLLPLCSLPLAMRQTLAIMSKEGAALNEHVGGTAQVQLAFCILLSASLAWLR